MKTTIVIREQDGVQHADYAELDGTYAGLHRAAVALATSLGVSRDERFRYWTSTLEPGAARRARMPRYDVGEHLPPVRHARRPAPTCYADGSFGHDHVRTVLANLLEEWWLAPDVQAALRAPMSDDASEELTALELLNAQACDGCEFVLEDGSLMLVPVEVAP